MDDELKLSIVIPVYNEKENIGPLLEEVRSAFAGITHEVIVVDDGSTDGTQEKLAECSSAMPSLKCVLFQDNRGQSAAMLAGFEEAQAAAVLTMDGDGQNVPQDGRFLFDRYVQEVEHRSGRPDGAGRRVPTGGGGEDGIESVSRAGAEGAVSVIGYRRNRADGWWKAFQSKIANQARDLITGDSITDTGCSLKVMPTDALLRIPRFKGVHRFLPTLLKAQGVRVIELGVDHRPRLTGVSKYGMWRRLIEGFRDAFGVRWLVKRHVHTGGSFLD